MADWPASLPSISLGLYSKAPIKLQMKSTPEDGPVISRARQTKMTFDFEVGWVFISETDIQTLYTFFDDYAGDTFNFTCPRSSTVHVVGFDQDALPKAKPSKALDPIDGSLGWKISGIKLKEH